MISNTSYRTGVLMRPMAYMYPEDENTHALWDQFLFGPTFLVAPILDEEATLEKFICLKVNGTP